MITFLLKYCYRDCHKLPSYPVQRMSVYRITTDRDSVGAQWSRGNSAGKTTLSSYIPGLYVGSLCTETFVGSLNVIAAVFAMHSVNTTRWLPYRLFHG